jgi:integrase
MSKTGRIVEIPILPPLMNFLLEQKDYAGNSEFVLPEHAAIYIKNPTGITTRVKKFLERIGIKTTKKVKGRSRAISIKDVHSLRHTFCYYAGVYGIPFLVVKDIVGHVSPEMTELYQRHADNRLKREMLMQMPDFMGISPKQELSLSEMEPGRQYLIELINRVPLNIVNKMIQLLENDCALEVNIMRVNTESENE